jgi:hypothetical protein
MRVANSSADKSENLAHSPPVVDWHVGKGQHAQQADCFHLRLSNLMPRRAVILRRAQDDLGDCLASPPKLLAMRRAHRSTTRGIWKPI